MTTPTADLQNLSQSSALVDLYILDASAIGGSIYHFTAHVMPNYSPVAFGGQTYTAIPIQTTGWDFTATGPAPKPTLAIANPLKVLLGAVISLKDLVGAKLTRIRTFEKYLDGGSSPDSSKFIGPDVYFVEQKTVHDNTLIQWQLTSVIDRMGMRLPRRQVLKDPTPQTPEGFPGVSRVRVQG